MPLRTSARFVIRLAVLCAATVSGATPAFAQADLSRFAAWFGGEWNNHEQVWQQRLDAADPKVTTQVEPNTQVHRLHAPVSAPRIGSHLFMVQHCAVADPECNCC